MLAFMTISRLGGTIALVIALTGCQKSLEQLNRDLKAANDSMRQQNELSRANKPGVMAQMPSSASGTEDQAATQLIVPNDPKMREAMEAALPTIKRVLSIHQCVNHPDGMLQLNKWAVPGVNLSGGVRWQYPNGRTEYHDRSKCMSVRSIDNWAMPALNALQFRAVYFADDSGETSNYRYFMKKGEDGSWRVQRID